MRNMNYTALAVLALASMSVCAAPANPLVRPSALAKKRAETGALGHPGVPQPGMPPAPVAAGQASAQELQQQTSLAIRQLQTVMSKYVVVAVAGDSAILRMLPGVVSAPMPSLQPQQPGMVMPVIPDPNQQQQANANKDAQATTSQYLPSLVVRHEKSIMLGELEVLPEVRNGQVELREVESGRAVFTGRLEGVASRSSGKITPVPNDMEYVMRNTPPIGSTGVVAASSSSTASTNK